MTVTTREIKLAGAVLGLSLPGREALASIPEGPNRVDVEIVDDSCSGAELLPETHCGLLLRLTPGAAGSRTAG